MDDEEKIVWEGKMLSTFLKILRKRIPLQKLIWLYHILSFEDILIYKKKFFRKKTFSADRGSTGKHSVKNAILFYVFPSVTLFYLMYILYSEAVVKRLLETQQQKMQGLILTGTADFIKKVLSVYTHSMTTIYLSLSAQVVILFQYLFRVPFQEIPWNVTRKL